MAKAIYVGAGSTAHKMKRAYVGVGGKARKVKKMYIGDSSGKARLCYSTELEKYGTATGLSSARFYLSAASVGNYAIFAGGQLISTGSDAQWSSTNVVDAYNASLTQTKATELTSKCLDCSTVTLNGRAIFAGGKSAYVRSYYATVDAYDASLTKTSLPALNAPKGDMGGATVGSKYAIFVSGRDYAGYYNTVDVYDASFTHTTGTEVSFKNRSVGISIGAYAIFAGAVGVDAYDASLTKTSIAGLENSYGTANYHTKVGVAIGNYAIFAGYSDAADVYDTSLTRRTATILSVKRSNLAVTRVGDYAVFAGGATDTTVLAVVDACDASLTRTTTTPLETGREYLVAATAGDYALVAGGRYSSDVYADVDVYTA